MTLHEALTLRKRDIITCACTTCGCDPTIEVKIWHYVRSCGCLEVGHMGNMEPFLHNAKDCMALAGKHRSRWGVRVTGRNVKLVRRAG